MIDGGPAAGGLREREGADLPRGSLRGQQDGWMGRHRANHGRLPPSAIAISMDSC